MCISDQDPHSKGRVGDSLTGPEWSHAHLPPYQGEQVLVEGKPKQLAIYPTGTTWDGLPKANWMLTSKRGEEMASLIAIHWNNSNYSLLACPLSLSLFLSISLYLIKYLHEITKAWKSPKKQAQEWNGKHYAWLVQNAWLRCNLLCANLTCQLFYLGRERRGMH